MHIFLMTIRLNIDPSRALQIHGHASSTRFCLTHNAAKHSWNRNYMTEKVGGGFGNGVKFLSVEAPVRFANKGVKSTRARVTFFRKAAAVSLLVEGIFFIPSGDCTLMI